ncbi:MAG: hypothetical protein NTV87_00125 [Ignavibacteriae bacterium]|nr:hypothetical protein [Ignavibacteriota bacterium]
MQNYFARLQFAVMIAVMFCFNVAFAVDDTNIVSLFSGTGALVTQIITALTALIVAWVVWPFIMRAYRGIKSVVSK